MAKTHVVDRIELRDIRELATWLNAGWSVVHVERRGGRWFCVITRQQ